ncbi:hypothetical protein J6590_065837 [Homalodisca vitripennis]|nr:hypothetical protein J6590_065837 [Homalodisca vitripennis]
MFVAYLVSFTCSLRNIDPLPGVAVRDNRRALIAGNGYARKGSEEVAHLQLLSACHAAHVNSALVDSLATRGVVAAQTRVTDRTYPNCRRVTKVVCPLPLSTPPTLHTRTHTFGYRYRGNWLVLISVLQVVLAGSKTLDFPLTYLVNRKHVLLQLCLFTLFPSL